MNGGKHIRELGAEETDLHIAQETLGFTTTDELSPLESIVDQPRALEALDLGLSIPDKGYNVYVSGSSGMGRREMVEGALRTRAAGEQRPRDWIYLNNFDHPDRPRAFPLEPGHGEKFAATMEELVQRLKDEIPKAFRQEDFTRERQRISRQYENRGRELLRQLEQEADRRSLIVQQNPDGNVVMVPKSKEGKALKPDEFEKLSREEKDEIGKRQQELGEKARDILSQQAEIRRRMREDVRGVEKEFAAKLIEPAVDEATGRYRDNGKLAGWLDKLKEHMIDNRQRFQQSSEGQGQQGLAALLGGGGGGGEASFQEYGVNVVVDNGGGEGAPLVIENSPNYKNLFGTIHGQFDRMGRALTDFTHIKAGSLLRANGGYLVFDLVEALIEPLVWKELKRTIKSGVLEYHMYDPFGVFGTSSLRPEPIPLKLKLVVIGTPLIYYLLHLYDDDFKEIFKVKADFAPEIRRTDGTDAVVGRLVRKLESMDGGMAMEAGAVAELARAGARMAGDKSKITAEFSRLSDVAREATYWARKEHSKVVRGAHVRTAIDRRVFRSDLIAEKIRELISEGTLKISLEGTVTGQLNGLSVAQLGDHMFGRPSRVTAGVGIGGAGLINIERESKLSGSTFDKAMLILEGYLRNTYAGNHPLALSASIAMEQSYGPIEGDSASAAELVCLLSAVGGVPLRQDVAVTGSVNQWGQVQAIGGVNEKIEGFFDVCAQQELTGGQGVCIPASNVKNLVLRPDVVEAIRKGHFHVWAVEHIDEILELLSGIDAGSPDTGESFHYRVDQSLQRMVKILSEQKAAAQHTPAPVLQQSSAQRDPRPPLPGKEL